MRKHCSICRNSFDVNRREHKTMHPDLDIFCSHNCTMRYIFEGSPQTIKTCHKPANMFGLVGKRSTYEDIVEEYFGIYGVRAAYEPFAIRLNDGHRYIPDFYLPDYNMLVEVKGMWASKGKTKMRKVIEVLPGHGIVLIPTHIVKQMEKVCRKVR